MLLNEEDDNLIRRYLLSELQNQPELAQQVEERLLGEDDFIAHFDLVGAELIDDYQDKRLDARERAAFEEHFLLTPQRRQQLALTMALQKSAAQNSAAHTAQPQQTGSRWTWQPTFFALRWHLAVLALVAVALGWGVWRAYFYQSAVDKGLIQLARAYHDERPVEARITGLPHAVFRKERGQAQFKQDAAARDLAGRLLLETAQTEPSAAAKHALGRFYLTQGEFDQALDQFEQALKLGLATAALHCDLGVALFEKAKAEKTGQAAAANELVYARSLSELNKALELDNHSLEAQFNRALLYQELKLDRQAREAWTKYLEQDAASPWALEAKQHLRRLEMSGQNPAQSLEQIQRAFYEANAKAETERAGQLSQLAYSALNEPLDGNRIISSLLDQFLAARLAQPPNQAAAHLQTLWRLGNWLLAQTGDRFVLDVTQLYQRASPAQLRVLQRARELAREAFSYYRQSNNDQAVAHFEQARQLFAQTGDLGEALYAEAWIGHCHHQRSDTRQNLAYFNRLVPALTARGYKWMEANARCGLANAQHSSGHYSLALAASQQCGQLATALGDQTGQLRSMYMQAAFYYGLGRHEENLKFVRAGIELAAQIKAELNYAITFYQLAGWSLSAQGYFDAALAFQQEAIRIAEERNSPRLSSRAQIHLGLIYGRWQKYAEGIAAIQRGIEIGRQLATDETGREFIHYGLLHLGHLYREAGRLPDALQAHNQVLEYFRQSRRQEYYYSASKGRFLTYLALQDDDRARAELQQVITLYEENRQRITEERNRNSFFDQEQGIYDLAVEFAFTRLHDPRLAFDYAEASHARSLFDAQQQEHNLSLEGGALGLTFTKSVPPLTLAELQVGLPAQVQVLAYAVLRDKLALWLFSQTSFEARLISLPQKELAAKISRVLELIRQPMSDWRAAATELHTQLLAPLEARLDPRKQLCVLPDKALHKLPFGALVSGLTGKTLLEAFTVSYAASANVLLNATAQAQAKNHGGHERLLSLGNPAFDRQAYPKLSALPDAEIEAAKIAALYPAATPLLGRQATKSALLEAGRQAEVLHLATHYVPDVQTPLFSRLLLAAPLEGPPQAGTLSLHELYAWQPLTPRLAILSACQTHAEEYFNGEGATGISRPFAAAGIPLVIASLWPVDSPATADLMIALHRARRRGGNTTANALREAQLALLHNSSVYQHPYYWAAFIAVGGYSEY